MRHSRRTLAAHGSVFLLLTVLTIAFLWPVARDVTGTVAGWEGDNLLCIRLMWWVEHAIVDLHRSPFFDPSAYYPDGYDVAHGPILAVNTVGGLPLTAAFGPVAAYNLMVLLSFPLTGLGTYLWVDRLTGSRQAGLVAAVIAAFLPYRFAHSVGHMHMMTTQWIPFALYGFERFWDTPKLRWAVCLGVTLGLVALSDWYYAYSAALMLPVYALVRTRGQLGLWTRTPLWVGFGVAGALVLILTVPFAVPYLQLASKGGMARSLADMEFWALNPYDFFTPNRLHPIWGDAVQRWFPRQGLYWVERNVMLGYAALAAAAVALRHHRAKPAIAACLAVWLASYLIALGPTLHFGDRLVLIPMPLLVTRGLDALLSLAPSLASLRAEISAQQAVPVPLPSFFLYLFVPITSSMRVMARFGIWTGLMTAALAGFGIAALLDRWRPSRVLRYVAVASVAGVVLFESYSSVPTMRVQARPVDRWLARQPADIAVVELPFEQTSRPLQDFYQTVHTRNWVFGPGFAFTPEIRVKRQALLEQFPAPESLDALRRWKTTYVLFTPSAMPDWPALRASVVATGAFTYEGAVGAVQVYRLR